MSEAERIDATERARWKRVETLFHAVSSLSPEESYLYLTNACVDELALRDEVLGLLGSNSAVNDLMATPVIADEHHLVRKGSSETGDPWIGRVLDGFRIEELLGRGGMGVVYLATRSEGILAQRVAIKVMARHLQSTPAQSQFLLERDALATLEHPHIAKLISGGLTADQLPFLAMEYVEGRRLDVAADDPSTSLKEIVSWMLQLCDAVRYVHRNLILHRDLKPGNVMVTKDGDVKLLDFGTLKGISQDAEVNSEMTQAGMRLVTLRYASPEHIRGEAGSTAVDVYSLGMTLYRLLAGTLPEMDDIPVDDYLRHLEQGKRQQPSSLMEPLRKKNHAALLEDLDAIVDKATRYRATDRYEGADALAADLRRALEERPVSAREGTVSYRFLRFTRRHRLMIASSTLGIAILSIGLYVMSREATIARAESVRADAGIEQERALAHLLLFDYFDRLKRIPGSTDAQRRAISQGLRYLDDISQHSLSPELQLDSIQAYTEMGLLQGSQYEENLGDVSGGIATLKKAVDSAQRLVKQNPANVKYVQSEVTAEKSLGQVYLAAGDKGKAIELLTQAADTSQQMSKIPGITSAALIQAASAVDNLGDTLGLPGVSTMHDPVKAIERYKQALEVYREGLKLDPGCVSCTHGIAVEDYKLGLDVQDNALAAAFYEDGLRVLATLPVAERATAKNVRSDTLLRQNLGALDVDLGKTAEGLTMLQTAQQRMRDAVAIDSLDARAKTDLALLDGRLASAYDDLGQYPQERDALREFVAMMNLLTHKDPANAVWKFRHALALSRYAQVEVRLGDSAEAVRAGKESLGVLLPLAQKPDADSRVLSIATEALVNLRLDPKRDGALAVSFAQRAIASKGRAEAEDYIALAQAQQMAGSLQDAKSSAFVALQMLSTENNSLSANNQRKLTSAIVKAADTDVASR